MILGRNNKLYENMTAASVTISSGIATIWQGFNELIPEAGVEDTLNTISFSGGVSFPIGFVILKVASGNTIIIEHGSGNIYLNGLADIELVGENSLFLFYDGVNFIDTGVVGLGLYLKRLDFDVNSFTAGASAPTATVVGTFPVFQFSNISTQEVHFDFEVPEYWKPGTDTNIYIRWAPADGTAGDVVWKIDYKPVLIENSEVISGAGSTLSVVDSTNALQDELLETGALTIPAADISDEDTIGIRLYRDTGDGSDTYGAAAQLVEAVIKFTAYRYGIPV